MAESATITSTDRNLEALMAARPSRPRRIAPPKRNPKGPLRPAVAAPAAVAPETVAPPTPVAGPQPEPVAEPQVAVPAPAPAAGVVKNVHARLPQPLFERLDAFVREVERNGWGQTSKIEIIQLLVSELPDAPDDDFGERLRRFRRAYAAL